jgi:hypothetical protein
VTHPAGPHPDERRREGGTLTAAPPDAGRAPEPTPSWLGRPTQRQLVIHSLLLRPEPDEERRP